MSNKEQLEKLLADCDNIDLEIRKCNLPEDRKVDEFAKVNEHREFLRGLISQSN